ncbi:MAG: YrrC family ATP-dependent DNA helicase, partial [Polyangiaceae bacterium]
MSHAARDPGSPTTAAPREAIHGTVERITFQNQETSFTVARLQEPGKQGPTTIVGVLFGVEEGEWLRCEGRRETNAQHGAQFRVETFEAATPENAYGIRKYLGSGVVPGIGAEFARRIVERFGDETLRVIEEEPERLFEVEGIGKKRHAQIVGAWAEHRALRRVLVFLRGHGVGAAHAARIHR